MESSNQFPACFHRVTIKGLCVRDGKVLLGRESEALSGKWELPGGGLDFGEDIREGFAREVMEETGLTVTKMDTRPMYVWTHRYEKRRKLDWFYSLVVAYRIELEDLNFTPSDECAELRFFSKEELESMDVCGQTVGLAKLFNPADFSTPF
ncbi:MAG TPA: NUDIX hydrolase [Candidatus Paceibacterota bacterium]|nr:NUDIX hydrolase [Candidatus Paceibacterota bacterium]